MELEALFGGKPQDIEFCFDSSNHLWIQQSRPITTFSNNDLRTSLSWTPPRLGNWTLENSHFGKVGDEY